MTEHDRRAMRHTINRRADELGAAVRYVFKREGRRLRLHQAVVMSHPDTIALAREHKTRRKARRHA